MYRQFLIHNLNDGSTKTVRGLLTQRSSAVSFVGHDPESEQLYVVFESGDRMYVYDEVDEASFRQIVNSSSIGKAVLNIKNSKPLFTSFDYEFLAMPDEPNMILADVTESLRSCVGL